MASPITQITATCACRAFSLTISFPLSSLPKPRALCLCTSCRTLSGSCGISYIPIPTHNPTIDPSNLSLTRYSTSEDIDRYFCSKCGAHVLCHSFEDNTWHLATGIWDRTEGIIKWTGCKWVKDTLDGGISIWLNEIQGPDGQARKMNRWVMQDRDGGELVLENTLRESIPTRTAVEGTDENNLKASCHCGGVKFYITRPNETSKTVYSPFPDLMIPFHTGASAANPEIKPWFLCSNNTKYLAGLCTCTSCRLASGFEIQPWAFVPRCNIFSEDGSVLDWEKGMGTLRTYDSSEGVWREFCGRCGASVFWHCKERPELVDVSVGLLDPREGARVEAWLEWWTERVSFEELAVSRGLVGSLEGGLRGWGRGKQAH